MNQFKIYIGEEEATLCDVIFHIINEFYNESLEPDETSIKHIEKLESNTVFTDDPKLIILSWGFVSEKNLSSYIEKNLNLEKDYCVIISDNKITLTPELNELLSKRIWGIEAPLNVNQLISALDQIFVSSKARHDMKYHRISFELLPEEGFPSPVDLFVRINQDHYVKILHKNDIIDDKFINKYEDKLNENLFIVIEDIDQFYEAKVSQSLKNLSLFTDKIIKIDPDAIPSMEDLSKSLGVREHTISVVNKITSEILNEIKKNPRLKDIAKQINGQQSFSKNLSQLTSYIVIQIASKSENANTQYFKKLIFASLFCDLLLNSDKLVMIKNLSNPNIGLFSQRDRKELLNHGLNCSEVISKTLNFSTDEIIIIENHHERPNGTGFPKGLNYRNINNNSSLFITAQEFAYNILEDLTQGEIKVGRILEKMAEEEFQGGHFAKYFKILATSLN